MNNAHEWITLSPEEVQATESDYYFSDAGNEEAVEKDAYWTDMTRYGSGDALKSRRYPGNDPGALPGVAPEDDVVMCLVQRVFDEFRNACLCTIETFSDPTRRQVWLVEPRSISHFSSVVRVFTNHDDFVHTERVLHFLSICRPVEKLPPDFDENCTANRALRRYCPHAQFVLVFNVPFTKHQIRQRKLKRGARRRLTLEVVTPPTRHYWSPGMHKFLPKKARLDIESVFKANARLPLKYYESHPFVSMPPPLVETILGYMVQPADLRGICHSKAKQEKKMMQQRGSDN